MSDQETFQISPEMAEMYEEHFVPAIFGDWAPHVVDAAGIEAGHAVLDVACGTGIVARTALPRVGASGRVVGCDLNPAMLQVAERVEPAVEWREGDAGALPFGNGAFDRVLCQAALMFFPDRMQALAEMGRVTAPGGRVAVQAWGTLAGSTGYAPFAEVVEKHAGAEALSLVSHYFVLGDLDALTQLFEGAGLVVTSTTTRLGPVRFPSIEAAVRTEIEATPLVDRMDAATYEKILADCETALAEFATADGCTLPIEGHIVTATHR